MTDGGEYFIGLMTGTSVDAIDAVLLEFRTDNFALHATNCTTIPDKLRREIFTLFTPGDNEIERLGAVDIALAELYAETVKGLCAKASIEAEQITAIGSHGQTIRHRPLGSTSSPHIARRFTLQIGDPSTIATLTGITTIADFRRKDMALGGQGAPLAPTFHRALAKKTNKYCAFLNIGGIANITVIEKNITGFDIGPGNALLDAWCSKHLSKHYDDGGAWARSGTIDASLLGSLTQHDFFTKPYPKSTGKEEFTLAWLKSALKRSPNIAPQDVQATLVALSVLTIAESLAHFPDIKHLYLCGGGVHNTFLVEQLCQKLKHLTIETTDTLGVGPDWIEAAAFAWMARQTLLKRPSNIASVTGAQREAILGGIYLP